MFSKNFLLAKISSVEILHKILGISLAKQMTIPNASSDHAIVFIVSICCL